MVDYLWNIIVSIWNISIRYFHETMRRYLDFVNIHMARLHHSWLWRLPISLEIIVIFNSKSVLVMVCLLRDMLVSRYCFNNCAILLLYRLLGPYSHLRHFTRPTCSLICKSWICLFICRRQCSILLLYNENMD